MRNPALWGILALAATPALAQAPLPASVPAPVIDNARVTVRDIALAPGKMGPAIPHAGDYVVLYFPGKLIGALFGTGVAEAALQKAQLTAAGDSTLLLAAVDQYHPTLRLRAPCGRSGRQAHRDQQATGQRLHRSAPPRRRWRPASLARRRPHAPAGGHDAARKDMPPGGGMSSTSRCLPLSASARRPRAAAPPSCDRAR